MSRRSHTDDEQPGFCEQILCYERRYQFYSRALGWVILLLLLATFVLGLSAAAWQVPQHPDCRAARGPLPQAIEPMRLELAGEPAEVRRLLRGTDDIVYPAVRPYSEAMCVEARVAKVRELLDLDGGMFIPLYLLLGFSALVWYGVLALRARGSDRARSGQVTNAFIVWLILSAAVLGVTAWLDATENRAAHAVLDLALGGLAPNDLTAVGWRAAVTAMHDASVAKWMALAAWAATLTVLAGLRRRSLSAPLGSERRRRWSVGIAWLLLVSGLIATLTLGAGAALAGVSSTEATNAWARDLLGIGFAAVFIHAVVLFVLHRLLLPRRVILPAPAGAPPHTRFSPAPPR